MLILALLFIGALAVGGVLWWQSQTNTAGGTSGSQVPQVAAPDQPAKAEPDAAQPSQTGAPPQGRKLIYERMLSDDSAPQPEQIVPREEATCLPAPSGNTGWRQPAITVTTTAAKLWLAATRGSGAGGPTGCKHTPDQTTKRGPPGLNRRLLPFQGRA
jgi:hypothetical protein